MSGQLRNIYWREIPRGATIEDAKHVFIVRIPGKPSAVAYWMGNEAHEAQANLKAMAAKSKFTAVSKPARRPTKKRPVAKKR